MSIAESSPIRASARASSRVAQRQHRRFAQEAEVVGPQHLVEVEVLELGGDPRVQHLHHLVGGDAVGEHPGDEGAGAGADVDVEVVDGAVDREQVEGAQGADLIDPAGEAAAAEDQGGLRGAFAGAPSPRLGLDVHNFSHEKGLSQGMRRRLAPLLAALLLALAARRRRAAAALRRSLCQRAEAAAGARGRAGQRPVGARSRNRQGRLPAGGAERSGRWPRT